MTTNSVLVSIEVAGETRRLRVCEPRPNGWRYVLTEEGLPIGQICENDEVSARYVALGFRDGRDRDTRNATLLAVCANQEWRVLGRVAT